jgi:hypothetical protein
MRMSFSGSGAFAERKQIQKSPEPTCRLARPESMPAPRRETNPSGESAIREIADEHFDVALKNDEVAATMTDAAQQASVMKGGEPDAADTAQEKTPDLPGFAGRRDFSHRPKVE